jgi:quinol monooxygenase YgiN
MFAVVGTWRMDAGSREQQRAVLPRLVDGVKQNRGFIRGYWADDLDEPDLSVTFVMFEEQEQARAFRQSVLANAPAQIQAGVERGSLRIVEIRADA